MPLELAATFVALLSLLTTGLALNVSAGRIRHRVPHGEGPNRELSRAIRAHMNSVEHLVPLGLLLLAYGLLGGSTTALIAIGSTALIARIALSIGILKKGAFPARRFGAYTTYFLEVALAVLVVFEVYARRR